MKLFERIGEFFKRFLFNSSWRCVVCGKEIFDQTHFCKECLNSLPVIAGATCNHCGRTLKASTQFCTTCKGRLIFLDKCRSVYDYKKPVSVLIKNFKYYNARYLCDLFAEGLVNLYLKNYLNVDGVVYVPMSSKAEKKRGYNQSKLLAQEFCKRTGIMLLDCLEKNKETVRQATLSKEARIKNLKKAFRVTDKKLVEGKSVVIIDDVSTTGSTGEALAECLKRAKATNVYLLTVASVAPKHGY